MYCTSGCNFACGWYKDIMFMIIASGFLNLCLPKKEEMDIIFRRIRFQFCNSWMMKIHTAPFLNYISFQLSIDESANNFHLGVNNVCICRINFRNSSFLFALKHKLISFMIIITGKRWQYKIKSLNCILLRFSHLFSTWRSYHIIFYKTRKFLYL